MRKFRHFTTTVPSTVGLAIEQNMHYGIQMSLAVCAAGIYSKIIEIYRYAHAARLQSLACKN